MRGRLTKRTPENAELLIRAIARGVPIVHACSLARICQQTFRDWRAEDEDFRTRLEEAVARGIERNIEQIEKASEKDWRAALALLVHMHPEHFSKSRVQVEHVGAVATFTVPQETLDEIAEARRKYEQGTITVPSEAPAIAASETPEAQDENDPA